MNSKQALVLVCVFTNTLFASVTINEFHYDNTGGDINEFIEIVIKDPLSISPGDVDVYLYNGSSGADYDSLSLADFVPNGILSDSYAYFSMLVPGIQNGGPDGIAVTHNGIVLEFISYEGSFEAEDGPASGMTSTDILVSEPTSTPLNSSLQRVCFTDTWILTEGSNTLGQVNAGCTTIPVPNAFLLTCMGLGLVRTTRRRIQ